MGNTWKEKAHGSIELEGETLVEINDNWLLPDETARAAVIDDMWSAIGLLRYEGFKCKYKGFPYLDAGDKILLIDNDDNENNSIIFNHTFTYNGSYDGEIDTPLVTKTETQLVNNQNTAKKSFRRVELAVDKINGEISSVIETQDEQSQTLTELRQTVGGLETTVEETTQAVSDLEETTKVFTVDLETYSVVIPTGTDKKPLSNQTIQINTYSYFKGSSVTPTIAKSGDHTGITCTTGTNKITFTVSASTAITTENNSYTFTFVYRDSDNHVWSLSKVVMVTLAVKGAQGQQGPQGEQRRTR